MWTFFGMVIMTLGQKMYFCPPYIRYALPKAHNAEKLFNEESRKEKLMHQRKKELKVQYLLLMKLSSM